MHMALPNLFPMWDNGIIDRYGLPDERLEGVGPENFVLGISHFDARELISRVTNCPGNRR